MRSRGTEARLRALEARVERVERDYVRAMEACLALASGTLDHASRAVAHAGLAELTLQGLPKGRGRA